MNIRIKDDFSFCMEMMYFLKTEEFKLFEFIYNSNESIPTNVINVVKKIIRELSYIVLKFKDYTLNLFK